MRNFKDQKTFHDFITQGKKAFSKRGPNDPLFRFFDIVYASLNLVHFVNEKSKDNKIKHSSNKNYIINLVTAAEIYFKDVLRLIPDFEKVKKQSSGVDELLRQRTVTLEWAYFLFKKSKGIDAGDILAASYTFENLETIDEVFSTIFQLKDKKNDKDKGKNLFLSKIEEHKPVDKDWKTFLQKFFETKNFCLKDDVPNWRQTLIDLFKKRHEYVHDICLDDKLDYKELPKYWWALMYFIYAVDIFIRDKYL